MWKKSKKTLMLITVIMAGFMALTLSPKKARACCSCVATVQTVESIQWPITINLINTYVTLEFIAHRSWFISLFFEDNIMQAMMMMANQLSAVAMQQAQIIGAFLDAKHQMETQRIFQTLQAQAHKDYHPSVGMCEFGSSIRSMAATERKGEYNAILLSQRSLDRQLGSANTAGAYGTDLDKESRLAQYQQAYCDIRDNNNGLAVLCGRTTNPTGAAAERLNADIDYARVVDFPWTLDVDFGDGTLTEAETDLIALSNNLYAHDLFTRVPPQMLQTPPNLPMTNMQKQFMDMRAVVAKRNVAENSFNAITAMKASGTTGGRDFMAAILEELGVPPAEALELVGDNPSYYAQMEILTKKIYQNPQFYVNLYDTPVNVERKGVALQAISLMQKFDMFKSYLRAEASLSVLLELAVMDLQDEVENEINPSTSDGED